jgi:hypothetical protein
MAQMLAAELSSRRPGFAPGLVHVGFIVDKLALGQVSVRVLRFPCQYHSIMALYIYTSPGGWTIGPLVATVHTDILTSSAWTTSIFQNLNNLLPIIFISFLNCFYFAKLIIIQTKRGITWRKIERKMNNIMNTVIWIATFVLGSLGSVFKSCMLDINTHFFYQLHIPVTQSFHSLWQEGLFCGCVPRRQLRLISSWKLFYRARKD